MAVDGRNIDWAGAVLGERRGGGDPLTGGGEPVHRYRGGVGHRARGVAVEGGGGGLGLEVGGEVHRGRLVVDVGHVRGGLVGPVGSRDVRIVATVVVALLVTRRNSYRSGGTV